MIELHNIILIEVFYFRNGYTMCCECLLLLRWNWCEVWFEYEILQELPG